MMIKHNNIANAGFRLWYFLPGIRDYPETRSKSWAFEN